MKQQRIELLCYSERENSEAGVAGVAQDVLNLREIEEGLKIVGDCEEKYTLRVSERLLLRSNTNDDELFITSIGAAIYINMEQVCVVDGEIIDVVKVGQFITVSTSNGYYYLKRNRGGGYDPIMLNDAIPSFRFQAVETVAINNSVAGYTLKGSYPNWVNTLSVEDLKGYTANVREAYSSCVNEAVSTGCWIQPIVVRCAVRLWDESVLWVGAPIVVGNGYQGVAYQRATVSITEGKVLPSTYSMSSYRLGLMVDSATGEVWDSLIKSVEIYACQEPEVILKGGSARCRCETTTTGGERKYLLSYALPSVSSDVATFNLVNSKSWRLLTRITDYTALRQGNVNALSVMPTRDADYPGTYSITRNDIFQSTVSSLAWVGIDHRLTIPSAMMVENGRLHSGDITSRLHCDWGLSAFGGLDNNSKGVNAVMKIKVGDATVVWSGTIDSLVLNAIIAYPDARATHIEVSVWRGGKVWNWSGNLMPSISENMSYFVSSDLAPIELTVTSSVNLIIPPQRNIEEQYHNRFTISMIENPFTVMLSSVVADSKIMALRAAVRPVATSIFGRYPLYAFTSKGIFALASSGSGREYGEPRCIDSRILSDKLLIAYSQSGIYFVAGGELCLINGANVDVISRNMNVKSIAWSSVYGELWCVDNRGNASIFIEKSKRWYRRDISLEGVMVGYNNAVAILRNRKVVDINSEVAASQDVYYRSYPISVSRRLSCVEWHILTDNSTLELQLTGDNGDSCHGGVLNIVRFSGEMLAPIKLPLFVPQKRVVRIIIEGNADAGLVIYSVGFES